MQVLRVCAFDKNKKSLHDFFTSLLVIPSKVLKPQILNASFKNFLILSVFALLIKIQKILQDIFTSMLVIPSKALKPQKSNACFKNALRKASKLQY